MSTRPAEHRGAAESREAQLLRKLIEKTAAGKITWRRVASTVTATTANGIQADFILTAPVPGPAPGWVLLTVRDQSRLIFRVEATQAGASALTQILAPMLDPTRKLAQDLFDTVMGVAEDDLGRALTKLDQV